MTDTQRQAEENFHRWLNEYGGFSDDTLKLIPESSPIGKLAKRVLELESLAVREREKNKEMEEKIRIAKNIFTGNQERIYNEAIALLSPHPPEKEEQG